MLAICYFIYSWCSLFLLSGYPFANKIFRLENIHIIPQPAFNQNEYSFREASQLANSFRMEVITFLTVMLSLVFE